ncbi:MAG: hypothetical protein WDN45_07320 [Caulobacteraceae bacterium]
MTALESTASTARVLNLLATHRKFPDDPELRDNPFFRNRVLNRSIILKHRLRPHEYQSFAAPKPTVTKVLIPIDGTDLRSGAIPSSWARAISTPSPRRPLATT